MAITIDGMTVTREDIRWAARPIIITYRGRYFEVRFEVRVSEPAGAGEYDMRWSYAVIETTTGRSSWDGSDRDYDSATTALQAAQVAIRQTVDDDADDQR